MIQSAVAANGHHNLISYMKIASLVTQKVFQVIKSLIFLFCFVKIRAHHRVHTEWQRPLFCGHWKNQPMLGRVGGERSSPFTPITYKIAVKAPAERADTLHLFHLYPYVLCGANCVFTYKLCSAWTHSTFNHSDGCGRLYRRKCNSLKISLSPLPQLHRRLLLLRLWNLLLQENLFVLLLNKLLLLHTAELSRKLKSRYGARNRFQEPSLELSSQDTQAGGPVRQHYAYLVPSPHSGTKVTDTGLSAVNPKLSNILQTVLFYVAIPYLDPKSPG